MPQTANPASVDTAALIAEGPGPDARHRWPLEGPGPWLLGRDALLATPWDREISRTHVKLSRTLEGLLVDKLPQARNPLFHEGQPVTTCQLASGGQFVIGTTVFRFVSGSATQSAASPTPTGDSNGSIEQVTFTRQTLDRIRYRDADRRIEILSRMPAMIGDAASDDELAPRLAGLLLAGVAHAEAAALVELQADGTVRVLAWDRRRETEGVEEAVRLEAEHVLEVAFHGLLEGAVKQSDVGQAEGISLNPDYRAGFNRRKQSVIRMPRPDRQNS